MRRTFWFGVIGVIGLVGLATLLSGCGGGGGGGGAPLLRGVTVSIGADAAQPARLAASDSTARGRVVLTAPLDAGATIDVYDFRNGTKITSGLIDASGSGSVELTAGMNVVVVITGTREGKNYRLSRIIGQVPTEDNTSYVVCPDTTLAAEAIAQTFYKKNQVVDQGTIDSVQEAAYAYLTAHPEFDISIGGGLIESGAGFGAANSLNATELAPVIAEVPATINNNLVLAKNAVQQIKEAGVYLRTFATDEQSVFDGFVQTWDDLATHVDEVGAQYGAVVERLSLLYAAIAKPEGSTFTYQSQHVRITDLTMGNGYQLTGLTLTDDPAIAQPGKITVDCPTGDGTYRLVATQSGGTWTVTQTLDGDPVLEYKVITPLTEPSGPNPTITGSISLKDQSLATPVAFNGTATAVGPDNQHYTHATFNGTLTSAEVTSSGSLAVDFPASKPDGARPEQTIYDFPSAFSMSDGELQIKAGTTATPLTLSLSGNLTATLGVVTVVTADLVPTRVTFDGTLTVTKTVSGHQTTVTLETPTGTSWANMTHVPNSDGADQAEVSSWSAQLQGAYSDSSTGLAFSGTISGTASNLEHGGLGSGGSGTATGALVGDLERTGSDYPAYSVNLTVGVTASPRTTTFTINSIGYAPYSLTGTGTVIAPPDAPSSGTFDLTNQAGVAFHLAYASTWSGTIKVSGQQVAAVTQENGMLKITFSDSTFEYLR